MVTKKLQKGYKMVTNPNTAFSRIFLMISDPAQWQAAAGTDATKKG